MTWSLHARRPLLLVRGTGLSGSQSLSAQRSTPRAQALEVRGGALTTHTAHKQVSFAHFRSCPEKEDTPSKTAATVAPAARVLANGAAADLFERS